MGHFNKIHVFHVIHSPYTCLAWTRLSNASRHSASLSQCLTSRLSRFFFSLLFLAHLLDGNGNGKNSHVNFSGPSGSRGGEFCYVCGIRLLFAVVQLTFVLAHFKKSQLPFSFLIIFIFDIYQWKILDEGVKSETALITVFI